MIFCLEESLCINSLWALFLHLTPLLLWSSCLLQQFYFPITLLFWLFYFSSQLLGPIRCVKLLLFICPEFTLGSIFRQPSTMAIWEWEIQQFLPLWIFDIPLGKLSVIWQSTKSSHFCSSFSESINTRDLPVSDSEFGLFVQLPGVPWG